MDNVNYRNINLRKRPVILTIAGKEFCFESIREASRQTGLKYQTLVSWLNGTESRSGITIKYQDEKL